MDRHDSHTLYTLCTTLTHNTYYDVVHWYT